MPRLEPSCSLLESKWPLGFKSPSQWLAGLRRVYGESVSARKPTRKKTRVRIQNQRGKMWNQQRPLLNGGRFARRQLLAVHPGGESGEESN